MLELHADGEEESAFEDPEVKREEKEEEAKRFWLLIIICAGCYSQI